MGLDTYAKKEVPCECGVGTIKKLPDDAAAAFESAGIELCGGMFSGNGNDGSFRGKVYAQLIEAATGVSLYHEWLDPEAVREMARGIHEALVDIENLDKFFSICDEYELGLVGWW